MAIRTADIPIKVKEALRREAGNLVDGNIAWHDGELDEMLTSHILSLSDDQQASFAIIVEDDIVVEVDAAGDATTRALLMQIVGVVRLRAGGLDEDRAKLYDFCDLFRRTLAPGNTTYGRRFFGARPLCRGRGVVVYDLEGAWAALGERYDFHYNATQD